VKFRVALLLVLSACDGCDGCGERRVRETIAVCSSAYGEVRFHPEQEWVWNPVTTGDGLAAGDWVRTGVESRALIKFQKTGSEIGIEPSSTVVIQEEAEPESTEAPLISRIKIESGVVRGQLASAQTTRAIEVSTPEGRPIRMEPGEPGKNFEYRVTVGREGIVELAVTKGRAKVNGADGSIIALGQGQAHDLVRGALVGEVIELPQVPSLDSPGASAKVAQREKGPIALSWSAVQNAEKYRVQVADEPTFSKPVFDEVVPGTSGAFEPAGLGTYYWRVAAQTKDGRQGEFGEPRELRVVEAPPDLLVSPVDDQTIKGKDRPLVEFVWKAAEPPVPYRLVVAKDRRLSKPVFEKKTQDLKVATRAIPSGTFFWGVYADAEPSKPLFTKARRLKIQKGAGLTTPSKVTFD
jgi:hypothetical protein